ncbi:MAG: hypothetical protein JO115_10165 [Pseudonocardiales bacterium]|nr:hypothetical protein [Pseudonocardiales bacterium]
MGPTPGHDGTTRYLCAAAHLDEEFCDKAIAEFLVEPVRAIPPSPGVDSAAVLREAVAAQTRRRIRDRILLALLVVLACANPITAISWTVLVGVAAALQAIGAGLIRHARRDGAQLPATDAGRTRRTVAVLVILAAPALAAPALAVLLQFATSSLDALFGDNADKILFPNTAWPTLLIGGLLLLVLVVDEFTVAKLVASSFRRGSFDPDANKAPSEWERRVRSLGHGSFRAELRRVSSSNESSHAAAGQADVVVYRGSTPFIGAGEQVAHHVMTLPLEPSGDDSDAKPVPISVTDLHRHVAESLAALRSPSSLSPGRRLARLQQREQVLLPADLLLLNRSVQTQPPVLTDLLPDLSRPPLAHLPLGAARALAENPLEWARYYSCFRVESWDRDLTTSCYLHIGTDQRMFYLERTYCILFPVRERYRSIDRPAESPLNTFGRSLVELIVLPASVLARLRSVFRRRKVLSQRAGVLVPDRYGAAESIRELAADTEAHTYFQDADTERYVNIMDRALVRAVGQFLEERGYSVVEFTRMADPVINNFNVQGNVTNSMLGGGNRNVRMNMASVGGTRGAK